MLRSSAERAALEALLGEPLMVDDPWITVRQAARILGVRPERVRELINTGALRTREPLRIGRGSRANRRLLLSDVLWDKTSLIRIGSPGPRGPVTVISVTEGADKPAKYPYMFRSTDLVVLDMIDMLYVDFDVDRCLDLIHQLNPDARVLRLSATRGDRVEAWYDWLTTV